MILLCTIHRLSPSRLQAINNRLHTTLTNTYDLINEEKRRHASESSGLLAELVKENNIFLKLY